MTMNEEMIRRYAGLMDELNLQKLSVSEDGTTISLEKPQMEREYVPASRPSSGAESLKEPDGELISVKSPMVGVFYAAPAENEDPYVSVGDTVKEGDVLCIIEAMKLMSEISSEESGIIEKICVTNGQLVEYGTELMQIRRR